MLKGMEKDKGGRPSKTGNIVQPVSKLADIGISKSQSSRWQKEAEVPAEIGNQITGCMVRLVVKLK